MIEGPYYQIAEMLQEGGWSSIYNFVSSAPDDWLEKEFPWAFEEEENDE